jgi:hypothetical protein
MANYSPANFDADLEHIVMVILKLPLAHPLALALSQSFINTFDDFWTIDIDDVHEFRYNMTTDPVDTPGTKLHVTVVKKIQRMVSYARFKEDKKDSDCNTQTYGILIYTLNGVEMVTLITYIINSSITWF